MTRQSRPFVDTDILIYAHTEEDCRCDRATAILAAGGIVSVQVLAEFAAIARRKMRMDDAKLDAVVANLLRLFVDPLAVDLAIFRDGRRIAGRYGYHQFDSQIIAAALAAGSRELLSEDMQHGQVIDGRLTIRNPFRPG